MRLNLGCSSDVRGGEWVNVDLVEPCDQVVDLSLPWLWEESSVDEIYAADIFEHIGDCDHTGTQNCIKCMPGCDDLLRLRHWCGRIHVMNEAHRVLKPGGILIMECPDAAKGAGQWQDPTHVSPWTPNSLQYFRDGSPAHKRFAAAYGITARLDVVSVTERRYEEWAGPAVEGRRVLCEVWKFRAEMKAVK